MPTVNNPENLLYYLLTKIDKSIAYNFFENTDSLFGPLYNLFTILLSIYVIVLGIGIWRGVIKINSNTFIYQTVKVAIVYSMVSTSIYYDDLIYDFFNDSPEAMAEAVTSGDVSDIYDLGKAMNQIDTITHQLRQNDSDVAKNIALAIKFSSYAYLATIISLLGISKIAMTIMLILGPIAFTMLMFKKTEKIFEAWLKQVITFFMYFVLVYLFIAISTDLYEEVITDLPPNTENYDWDKAMPLLILNTMLMALLSRIPGIASSIGGGAYLDAGNFSGKSRSIVGNPNNSTRPNEIHQIQPNR